MNLKKTAICTAVTAAIGLSTGGASAQMIDMNFSGWFTMLNASGGFLLNDPDQLGNHPMYGRRTPVNGTMHFDTSTGAGTGSMNAFSFFGSGFASATTISFQAIGNGTGGEGPLVLGNMGFNWNDNNGIPTSIVMDASGFFAAVAGGLTTGQTIGTGCTGCVFGASENTISNFAGFGTYTLPMGSNAMATTTWNTTNIGTPVLGDNPSGTLPLIADTIGGTPMQTAPFAGFNANFDITDITITAVPVPAAVWLFGSGLIGLVGVARRRKKA